MKKIWAKPSIDLVGQLSHAQGTGDDPSNP